MITHRYLQVTYRNGRPFAAYLYLPRKLGDKSARSVRCENGLVIDYAADGREIGLEITAPQATSIETINRVLSAANLQLATQAELQPLLPAAA